MNEHQLYKVNVVHCGLKINIGAIAMNTLPIEKKILILSLLAEGNSLRTISRVSGVARNTISSLLLDAGEKAGEIMNREMVNLKVSKLQVDEIWTFVGKKQKMLKPEEMNTDLGDQYVFVALDAETKLVPAFSVGKRTGEMAHSFMKELQQRIISRFQLTTDAFAPYFNAVDSVFGEDIDYGQIHKEYREDSKGERRYSPGQIARVIIRPLIGNPKRKHISTSYIERQNLTMRMQMRRFTRLTNGFSRSLKHLEAALALHFFHYNWMRIHETLKVTPAMEAGISKHLTTWEDFLSWDNEQRIAA
ncbi:MAG: IS1 family transposase [Bacteroidota bacterium]